MENIKDILKSLPTIKEQVEMYKSGRYGELAEESEYDRIAQYTQIPEIADWMLWLVTLDEKEAGRARKVCEAIGQVDSESAEALVGTLRDSILRNGQSLASSHPQPKMRGSMVRFAIFVIVEKFRLAGLKRDEAIDCVSRMKGRSELASIPSAQTILDWYDKKHGVEYTGIKQFAELLVGDANSIMNPLLLLWCRTISRNMSLITVLHKCSVITNEERTQIKLGAQRLHGLASIFMHIFSDNGDDPDYRRIRKRLNVIDREDVIRKAVPILFGNKVMEAKAIH